MFILHGLSVGQCYDQDKSCENHDCLHDREPFKMARHLFRRVLRRGASTIPPVLIRRHIYLLRVYFGYYLLGVCHYVAIGAHRFRFLGTRAQAVVMRSDRDAGRGWPQVIHAGAIIATR